jgi:calcium-dependent protein kinase
MGNCCARTSVAAGEPARVPARRLSIREALVHERRADSPAEYTVVRKLGSGLSGVVSLVQNRQGTQFAMKVLHAEVGARLDDFRNEVRLLRALDCPFIIKLHEFFESRDGRICIVMEPLFGGELYDRLSQMPSTRFAEAEAAQLLLQMTSAISYLHAEGIVHRDLKLENFLFREKDSNDLCLIDFGLSHRLSSGQAMRSCVGTPYYIAPEVLSASPSSAGYDERIDAWSLGVIAYMLLSGTPPFRGRRDADVLSAVRRGRFTLSGPAFEGVSDAAKDFIRQLLVFDPARRMRVADALQHPWLSPVLRAIEQAPLPPGLISGMRHFAHLHGWKRAALEAAAFTAPDDSGEIAALRLAFQRIDHGSGHVTEADFSRMLAEQGVGEAEAGALFRTISMGGTSITYSMFVAATLPRRMLTRALLHESFNALDVDNRGYLTLEGLTAVLGAEIDTTSLKEDLFLDSARCYFQRFSTAFFFQHRGEDDEPADEALPATPPPAPAAAAPPTGAA